MSALRHHWRLSTAILGHARTSDVVVHCARALPEGVAAWLSRLRGGPRFVCWTHGEDLLSASTSRELSFVTRAVYRAADYAIANSRYTAGELGRYGVPREKVHVVHPGVDPTRFSPDVDGTALRQSLAAPEDILILSVGRLQRRKGQDLTIRAVARLHDSLPQLRYIVAGTGDDLSYLQALAAELGVSDRVHFLHDVAVDVLPQLYAAVDVFVLPNRIEQADIEGFGIVFLEAASTGKPVIGGNSGGVPEAVQDGVNGILVSGTDVDELAATISRLACDPNLRERFGRAGRQRVLDSFRWEVGASSIAALHERMVRPT